MLSCEDQIRCEMKTIRFRTTIYYKEEKETKQRSNKLITEQ